MADELQLPPAYVLDPSDQRTEPASAAGDADESYEKGYHGADAVDRGMWGRPEDSGTFADHARTHHTDERK